MDMCIYTFVVSHISFKGTMICGKRLIEGFKEKAKGKSWPLHVDIAYIHTHTHTNVPMKSNWVWVYNETLPKYTEDE